MWEKNYNFITFQCIEFHYWSIVLNSSPYHYSGSSGGRGSGEVKFLTLACAPCHLYSLQLTSPAACSHHACVSWNLPTDTFSSHACTPCSFIDC